jgi:hypothetical protein
MKQTFEDYRREVLARADEAAQLGDAHQCSDHLESYNFGRTVQRIESLRRDYWVRIGCLLAGIAIGVACSSGYPRYLYSTLAQTLHTQVASHIAQVESTPGFPRVANAVRK